MDAYNLDDWMQTEFWQEEGAASDCRQRYPTTHPKAYLQVADKKACIQWRGCRKTSRTEKVEVNELMGRVQNGPRNQRDENWK